MSTGIAKPEPKMTPADKALAYLMEQIEKRGARLENLLHPDMPKERFEESCRLAFAKNPDLTDLSKTDGPSLMQAILLGARSGLDVHGHYGHLVSFTKDKQTGKAIIVFMADYRGLLATAKTTGTILDADAVLVYEKDEFQPTGGEEARIRHIPFVRRKPTDDKGGIIAAYTRFLLPSGRWVVKGLMLLEDIERIEGGIRSKSGPWGSVHRGRMIMKSSFRQAWPWLGVTTSDRAMALRLQALEEAEAIEGDWSRQPDAPTLSGVAGAKEAVQKRLRAAGSFAMPPASVQDAIVAQQEPTAEERAEVLKMEMQLAEPGSEG